MMITALPRLRLIPNEFATREISFGSELTGDTPRLDLSESDTPKAIIKRPTTYTKIRLNKLLHPYDSLRLLFFYFFGLTKLLATLHKKKNLHPKWRFPCTNVPTFGIQFNFIIQRTKAKINSMS